LNDLISVNKLALSDKSGARDFFVYGGLSGINSLNPNEEASVEQVECIQLDEFVALKQIDRVLFSKSDTEGHDYNVLLGATKFFQQGRVDVWQFEYNHRWLEVKAQLKDVFNFIADKPYLLGKLHGRGVEIYQQWHPELERYFEANYLLIRRGSEFEKLCSYVRFNSRNVLESVNP
jgi:hypothetical protein